MTNHTPTFTSSGANVSFTETSNTTGSLVLHTLTGTMNFSDSDHSDTHTTSATLHSAVLSSGSVIPAASLTHFNSAMSSQILSDNNGSGSLRWSFGDADDDFDFLAKNQTLVLTYDISVSDNHGGTVKQTVKVTVTGTDDKPVFNMSAVATVTEQANHTLSFSSDTVHVAMAFTDDDLTNTGHTACVTGVSASGVTSGILPGSLGTAELMAFFNIDNVVKASGSSNGTINTTFSAPDLAFDYLAAGEQLNVTYTVQLDDHAGGVSTQTVTVTVVGTNDKPVVLAFPESAHLTEDHDLSGGNLTAHCDFLFSDIDLSDTHTVSTTVDATRSSGGAVPISNADLIAAMGATIDPDSTSQLLGDVKWNFALANSAVNFLGDGETLTLNYHITVTDSSGASDTEEVCITVLGTNHPIVTKTATVPGGTADVAGEVISYTITVGNAGHSTLTGITVTDPSVSNLAPALSSGFNVGDTNHDNKLSVGETWQYTASHTVTQNDLNTNGGGDGSIDNTVTVGSDQALPVSATASVTVANGGSIDLTKTADVTSVDSAGDVINYTIAIQNTGNTVLTFPLVNDSQVNIVTPIIDFNAPVLGAPLIGPVIAGDYNAGDTNQNGFQDPGETFQFQIVGDTNNNGIEDSGETFVRTNVGDTNQNGSPDPGEVFQFSNAGDTNHNGEVDSGETFLFSVDHTATPVLSGAFNAGDVNHDGQINVGETWQYTVSYTVTQADIDNGGVVNPALTHDNTATVGTSEGLTDSGSVSVSVVQNPHVTLHKSASVADGTADHAGDVINYAITVANAGNMTLTGVSVSDPSVTDLAAVMSGGFNAGDTDHDGKLDLGETWQYTASHTVTQGEIDAGGSISNTASVSTAQGASANDTASVTVVPPPPAMSIDMSLSNFVDVGPTGADAGGDLIQFAVGVTNNTAGTLTSFDISDLLGDIPGSLQNPIPASLGAGATFFTTYNHFLTAADVSAHQVADDVTATGIDPASHLQQATQHWVVTF